MSVCLDQRPEGWSDSAAAYHEWFAPLSARFAVNALRLLRLRPGERLLDVAAGTGSLALQAARAGARVCAVDFAPGMVRLARELLSGAGAAVCVEQMDGQALRYASASFDAACSMFGLIFFPDPGTGLRELCRVVRPGGQVLVTSWDRDGFPLPRAVQQALLAVRDLPRPSGPGPALRLADRRTLETFLIRAGLREVAVLEVTHDWVIPDPAALFRSLPQWSAPLAPLFRGLTPTDVARAAAAFAEIVTAVSRPSGGLRTTSLFGHGIRDLDDRTNQEDLHDRYRHA